jgi:hypothetical protein
MPYVSAQYAPPLPPEMLANVKAGDPRRVIATDDQGVEWHLTEDSQVGDWLRYIEADGKIASAREGEAKPAPAKAKAAKKETKK